MPVSSIVFRLPGELRNKVYKHALTSPTPLLLVMGNADLPILTSASCDDVPHEFNQLQYVNKQLLLETSGIEVLFNDIKVARKQERDETPGLLWLEWLDTTAQLNRTWLDGCTIVLTDEFYAQVENRDTGLGYGYMSESAKTIANLAKFCNAHPNVKMDYILPCLDLSDIQDRRYFGGMISTAYLYVCALVTEEFDKYKWPFGAVNFAWSGGIDRDVAHWREYNNFRRIGVDELQAPNLRFKPIGTEDKESLARLLAHVFPPGSPRSATIVRWAEHGL